METTRSNRDFKSEGKQNHVGFFDFNGRIAVYANKANFLGNQAFCSR